MMWRDLRGVLAESGIRLATIDVIERERGQLVGVPFISWGWSNDSERCLAAGGMPAVMFTWESPVVIWDVYDRLPELARIFRRLMLLPGAARRVPPSLFVPMLVPRRLEPVSEDPWEPRRHLVMINSRHVADPVSVGELVRAVTLRHVRPRDADRPGIRRQLVCLRDADLRRELYSERLRAIRSLSGSPGFDLFGRGWAEADGNGRIDLRNYRGETDDKLATMRGYRFAFAIENTSFPGYISEKIFDCFFAGCVPVYLGAPDVAQYIPPTCYVDVRAFRTYRELDEHLRAMTAAEAELRRAAARAFLASTAYRRFDHATIAADLATAFTAAISEGQG